MSARLDRRMQSLRQNLRAYVRGTLPGTGRASACSSRRTNQTGSASRFPMHVRKKVFSALVATAPAALSALPLLEHETRGRQQRAAAGRLPGMRPRHRRGAGGPRRHDHLRHGGRRAAPPRFRRRLRAAAAVVEDGPRSVPQHARRRGAGTSADRTRRGPSAPQASSPLKRRSPLNSSGATRASRSSPSSVARTARCATAHATRHTANST